METQTARGLLEKVREEISDSRGIARTESFLGLRAVDAKVRQVRMILSEVPGSGFARLLADMGTDIDFQANSRRVRLEALLNYIRSALSLITSGAIQTEKPILKAPDVASLTSAMPGLKDVVEERWIEAQECRHIGAHLASIILMGSILEGLLLARASRDLPLSRGFAVFHTSTLGTVRDFS